MQSCQALEAKIRDELEIIGADLGLPPIASDRLISSHYSEILIRIGEIKISNACTPEMDDQLARYYRLLDIGMYVEFA